MKNRKIAALLNGLTLIMEIYGFVIRPESEIPAAFYYTVFSNYVALFSNVIWLIFCTREKTPKAVRILRFSAMCMLVTTFVIVVAVLVWFTDPIDLFFGTNKLFHHTLCPILTFVSVVWFEEKPEKQKMIWIPIGLSAIYYVTAIYENAIGAFEGPYPFLMLKRFGWPKIILFFVLIFSFFTGLFTLIFKFCNHKSH